MAFDIKFYENVDALASAMDDLERMASLPEATLETMVLRNASLQAGYFIPVARSCGLDCGPMSSFNPTKIDELFSSETSWRSYFLMTLGYGVHDNPKPRWSRLAFGHACRIE